MRSKRLIRNHSPGLDGFTVEFYQKLKKRVIAYSQTIPKYGRGRDTPKLIIQDQVSCDNKPHKHYRKGKYRSIFLMNIDKKILNKM